MLYNKYLYNASAEIPHEINDLKIIAFNKIALYSTGSSN